MIDSFTEEYRFLSNFFDCLVDVKGRLFASSEHAYQAAKTLDPVWQEDIRLARSPASAKLLGRECPLREDWEEVKIPVMRFVLACKFKPDTALAERLLNTGWEELVEGNTWKDYFWGAVLDHDTQAWIGQNWLGKLLMERREELRGR